jgi:hypothetical protein
MDALDNEMIAVGYGPIPGIRGRIPDFEVNEAARIWGIVESAHPELLDVVKQLLGMVNDYRILSSERGELRAERARLRAWIRTEVRRESGVRGGGGASADGESDSGLFATVNDLGRVAVRRRRVVEARLGKPMEDLRRAIDVTTSLRAQLPWAETPLHWGLGSWR